MHFVNDSRPWTDGVEHDLSIVDVMKSDTISALPAAMLWWTLERGASLLTAGGPQGAGKSTLANALLPFLPSEARVYVVSGRDDVLTLPAGNGPMYLLISEFSRHGRPTYLSGPTAQRAFALLRHGPRMVGTMHADSVREAVDSLRHEFELPVHDIARITLVVITRITRGAFQRGPVSTASPDIERRVVEIGLLSRGDDGVRVASIASWNGATDRLEVLDPRATGGSLATWAGVEPAEADEAIRVRAHMLTDLLHEGRRAPDDIATAVRRFREQPST